MKSKKQKLASMKKYILLTVLVFLVTVSCQQASEIKGRDYSQQQDITRDVRERDGLDSAVESLMKKHSVPGVSVALMQKGKAVTPRNYGIVQKGKTDKIDPQTMFSVGSVSKVANAIIVLKLVDEGKLDLDEDVNTYLKSWKIPSNEFTKDNPITLRHILSHTAGFSVHGFADYYPGEKLPSPIQTLNGENPSKSGKVEVIFAPGSKFKYSGGGITVAQQIVADITGMPYEKAAAKILFEPMGLKRTSYANPLPSDFGNIAKAHNGNGKAVALPRGYQAMPEMAASGLWTTPSDFLQIFSALLKTSEDKSSRYLSTDILKEMITRQKNTQFGLGPRTGRNKDRTFISHGGSNESYKASFKLFWDEKTGYAIFTNSASGSDFINELRPVLEKHLGF